MIIKLFLLGRPGCGKSSAAKHIEESSMKNERLADESALRIIDILQDMTARRTVINKNLRLYTSDGFDVVIDDSVLLKMP